MTNQSLTGDCTEFAWQRPAIWLQALRSFTRQAYRIKRLGFGRVCEFIRRRVAKVAVRRHVLIDDFMGSLKFCCALDEHMGSQVFFRGTYSGDQLEVLCNLLQPGDLFVDGGANQGEFTVLAASLVGPSGKVLAFEPVSKIRERLTLNISLNSFQNVDVHALGLGDKSEVNVPIFDSHETFRDGTIHEGLFSLYVHHLESEEIAEHIAIITLDEICSQLGKRVKLIKLDIEGAEAAALRGAEQTILRDKPSIIFEANALTAQSAGYSVDDLISWLELRDYQLFSIGDGGRLTQLPDEHYKSKFSNLLARPNDS